MEKANVIPLEKKNPLMSKTLWFNVISGALVLVDHFTQANMIPKDIAFLIVTGGNFVLRFFTSKPVK